MKLERSDINSLNSSVSEFTSALKSLENVKAMMLAVEREVFMNKISELHGQIKLRKNEASSRGLREIEQVYQECSEMLSSAKPTQIVNNLLEVKRKLQSSLFMFSENSGIRLSA